MLYIFSDVTETKEVDQIDNLNSLKLTSNCHLQVILYQSYIFFQQLLQNVTSNCYWDLCLLYKTWDRRIFFVEINIDFDIYQSDVRFWSNWWKIKSLCQRMTCADSKKVRSLTEALVKCAWPSGKVIVWKSRRDCEYLAYF